MNEPTGGPGGPAPLRHPSLLSSPCAVVTHHMSHSSATLTTTEMPRSSPQHRATFTGQLLGFDLENSVLEAQLIHTPDRETRQAHCWTRGAGWLLRRCVPGQPGQVADLTGRATWGFWKHTQNCLSWKSGFVSPSCL